MSKCAADLASEQTNPTPLHPQGNCANPTSEATLHPVWEQPVIDVGGIHYRRHDDAGLFPKRNEESDLALQESVRAVSQLEDIVIDGDVVLDGYRRLCAVIAVGGDPRFVAFSGGDRLAFILSKNLIRSHWSAGQSASIVAQLQDWRAACPHGGRRDQAAILPLDRVEDRARLASVSAKTQGKADRLAKASPSLLRKVIDGELPLDKALAQLEDERGQKKIENPDPHAECDQTIAELRGRLGQADLDAARVREQADKIVTLEALIVELRGQVESFRTSAEMLADRDAEILELRKRLARYESHGERQHLAAA